MARRPPPGELPTPRLMPAASPVDSLVRPNAGAQLGEIAAALGGLSPSLARIQAKQREDEEKRGRTDATQIYEDIKATRQKIKTGEIAAHESKWYRAAAREQVGQLLANAYGQELLLSTKTDEALRESIDPDDFDAFEAEQRKRWLAEHLDGDDPALMAGFNAVTAQGILNARQSFIADVADRMDGQVLDNTYVQHQIALKESLDAGLSIEEIGKNLATRNAAFYNANPKLGKSLARTTVQAIFDAARAYEDPDILKLLDAVPGGTPGSTLGMTRDAMSKRSEVEREIRSNRQNRLTAEEKDEKRERLRVVDSVYDEAIAALEADPEADMKPFAQRLGDVDRREIDKLYRLATGFHNRSHADDELVAGGLRERAINDDLDFGDVVAAMQAGKLSWKTAKELRGIIKSNRAGSGSAKALVQDPLFTQAKSQLSSMWVRHMGDVPGARGAYSEMQLTREWIVMSQSPEFQAASELEKVEFLQKAVTRVFRRFASDKDAAEILSLEESAQPPDRTTKQFGPIRPSWESEPVLPPNVDLDRFEREYNELVAGRRSKLSDWSMNFVLGFDLKAEDVPKFIAAQRKARAQR
jgi:hypothetical protein